MFKKHWKLAALLGLPLILSGLAYGGTLSEAKTAQENDGYTCPLTGDELACPDCCPVNQ